MLDEKELARYNRQIRIPIIGEAGQEKLKTAHVVIAGVGGLGCTSATYLAAAGVGHLTIIDCGLVELSNLNRQVLYGEQDVGQKKVEIARKRLKSLNSNIEISPLFLKVDHQNISAAIESAQLVVDGLDNAAARLAVNFACVRKLKPFIYGGVSRLRGRMTTILPGKTPCLACLNSEGRTGQGVLGVTPAIIANLQALEAIKLVLGLSPSLAGKLLMFNGDDMQFNFLDIERDPCCKVCSSVPPY
jgi:molybdopterin-synthase adenylyltransferase